MKVEILIRGLNDIQKKLIRADFEHTKWLIYDEMYKTIDKLKGNRGMQYKIVNMLSGITAFSKLTVESFVTALETMKTANVNLFDYSVRDMGEAGTFVEMTVDDIYFDILRTVPVMGSILRIMGDGKTAFVSKIEKSLRNDYTSDYVLKVTG
jgi:hypothetical protein